MEVLGKIKVINAVQQVSASFKKRELVVETQEQYPQPIMIEFVQDKCDLLNQFKVGDDVNVSINLRGREWINPQGEAKYFNQIQGWKISKVTDAVNKTEVNQPEVIKPILNAADESQDLPF